VGFLDKLRQQASDVASTVAEKTQETAKVGQLQVQLRNLRSEEKDALADFGREAYDQHAAGTLGNASAALAAAATRIAEVRSRIAAKEHELNEVRQHEAEGSTVESTAEEVPDAPTVRPTGEESTTSTPETPAGEGS
jgi:hypothetical protein